MYKKIIFFLILLISQEKIVQAKEQNIIINQLSIEQLNQEISKLNHTYEQNQKDCYKDFFINYCLNKVKKDFYLQYDNLEKELINKKRQQRQFAFEQSEIRRNNIQQKLNLHQPETSLKEQENIIEYQQKQINNQKRFNDSTTQDENIKIVDIELISSNIKPLENLTIDTKQPFNSNTSFKANNKINKLQQEEQRKQNLQQRNKKLDKYLKKNQ